MPRSIQKEHSVKFCEGCKTDELDFCQLFQYGGKDHSECACDTAQSHSFLSSNAVTAAEESVAILDRRFNSSYGVSFREAIDKSGVNLNSECADTAVRNVLRSVEDHLQDNDDIRLLSSGQTISAYDRDRLYTYYESKTHAKERTEQKEQKKSRACVSL